MPEAKVDVLTACAVIREHGGKGDVETCNSIADSLDVERDVPETITAAPKSRSLHLVTEDEGFSEPAASDEGDEQGGQSLKGGDLDNDHLTPEATPTAIRAPSSDSTDLQRLLRSLYMIRDHGSFIVACKEKTALTRETFVDLPAGDFEKKMAKYAISQAWTSMVEAMKGMDVVLLFPQSNINSSTIWPDLWKTLDGVYTRQGRQFFYKFDEIYRQRCACAHSFGNPLLPKATGDSAYNSAHHWDCMKSHLAYILRQSNETIAELEGRKVELEIQLAERQRAYEEENAATTGSSSCEAADIVDGSGALDKVSICSSGSFDGAGGVEEGWMWTGRDESVATFDLTDDADGSSSVGECSDSDSQAWSEEGDSAVAGAEVATSSWADELPDDEDAQEDSAERSPCGFLADAASPSDAWPSSDSETTIVDVDLSWDSCGSYGTEWDVATDAPLVKHIEMAPRESAEDILWNAVSVGTLGHRGVCDSVTDAYRSLLDVVSAESFWK